MQASLVPSPRLPTQSRTEKPLEQRKAKVNVALESDGRKRVNNFGQDYVDVCMTE